MKEKTGGRPKKNLSEKLKYRVAVKLCTADFYALKSKAKAAGMSYTELARQAILSCKISTRITPEQASWLRQLSGIANNLNQATRKLHQQGRNEDYRPIAAQIDSISKLILDDGKNK